MGKLSEKELTNWEKTRDLNAELMRGLREMKRAGWARKTEFLPRRDGSIRRVIFRRDGTIEKDHIIPAERALVARARAVTGLSQAAFAGLLGVSVRTLQEWEQGRKTPSGGRGHAAEGGSQASQRLEGVGGVTFRGPTGGADMNAMEGVVSRKTFIEKRLAEGLDDIKRGRTHGPFSSASALIRSLHHEMKKRKKR